MVKEQEGSKKASRTTAIGGVSIVMPSYNAASWLEVTLGKIEAALAEAGFNKYSAEIVIVDDGSIDDTKKVVSELKKKQKIPVNYIYQKNAGRYIARKTGVDQARYDYVWFVDTRVHVSKNSLKYAKSEIIKSKENAVWNAHVHVVKKGNIIARFMDAITFIGWRRYFRKPRRTSYGLDEFDYYPKGTTSFLVPKNLIVEAMNEFEQEDHDMQRSSDDTHLIRIIARDHQINLSPKFSCKYHARNTFKAFSKHSFHRGQVFIDGFFRPGTRFYVPIILFLLISASAVVSVFVSPSLILAYAALFIILWFIELVAALLLGVARKDALSLFLLTPVFAANYGAGLWVAFLRRVRKAAFDKKNSNTILAITAAFIFFSITTAFFYAGKSSFDCGGMLASGPGDQIGLVWLNTMTEGPLWGWSSISNAPYGENVQSPVHITGVIEYGLFWLFSLAAGPVCGYNLFTSFSLIFSAMIVFLFTRWLTKRTDVSLLAGFAATFTPYLMIKTGVHPSYALYGVFVLAIWLLVSLWNKPTKSKAVFLGLVTSSFFFIDPYFILLGGITILAAVLVFVTRIIYLLVKTRNLRRERVESKAKFRAFIANGGLAILITFLCGVTPLLITNMIHGAQINKEVSSVRSDIKVEIMNYSARPFEYFLPNAQHPLLGSFDLDGGALLTRKPHGSNPAEDTLALSYMALLLGAIAVIVTVLYSLRAKIKGRIRGVRVARQYAVVVGVLTVVGLAAFITSFPTKTHGIVFPAEIISNYIQIWRVYSRMAVIVMFSIAILAAIGLAFITSRFGKKTRWFITMGAILIVGFEFLTFNPFDDNRSWSYKQVHPFYSWLKQQDDIRIIAEYPLNEPGMTNVTNAYFRDQYIHRKMTINAYAAANPMSPLRNSLRDITDPQTASALAALGVDMIVVHGEDTKNIPVVPGLIEVDWNNSTKDRDSVYATGQLKAYRVVAHKDEDGYVAGPGEGFLPLVRINSTYTAAGYVMYDKAAIRIYSLKTGRTAEPKGIKTLSFNIVADKEGVDVRIDQGGSTIWKGRLGAQSRFVSVAVDTSKPIQLVTSLEKSDRPAGVVVSEIDLK